MIIILHELSSFKKKYIHDTFSVDLIESCFFQLKKKSDLIWFCSMSDIKPTQMTLSDIVITGNEAIFPEYFGGMVLC